MMNTSSTLLMNASLIMPRGMGSLPLSYGRGCVSGGGLRIRVLPVSQLNLECRIEASNSTSNLF